MTHEQFAVLRKLSHGRCLLFAPSYDETRIHRQLVMMGYASCRVEYAGEFISISDQGRQEVTR
jgi:hypothetical protein